MRYKLITFIVAALLSCTTAHSDLASDMQGMFDNMGVYSNVTPSAVYAGEANNLITGGSLYLRAPVKNYGLYSFNMPGASGGCGGIDMFLGSFGFINKEQFISMLRNIGNNSMGLAFQLAIDSMSSMLGINMKDLRAELSKWTQDSINTCKTSKYLVGAVADQITDVNIDTCVRWQMTLGRASNESDARYQCQDADEKKQTQVAAKVSDPDNNQTSVKYTGGNLLWAIGLDKAGLTSDDADLLMSIMGIVIATPIDNEKGVTIEYKPALITDIRDLLHGKSGASPVNKKIIIDTYKCTDLTFQGQTYEKASCSKPVAGSEVEIPHIPTLISDDMELVLGELGDTARASFAASGTGYSDEAATAIGKLMGYSSVPINKILAYDLASGQQTRSQYINLMAIDHLSAMMDEYISLARAALGQAKPFTDDDRSEVQLALDTLTNFERDIRKARAKESRAIATFISIEKDVIQMTQRMQMALGRRIGS